jgi:hypothetical protein
LGFEREVAKYRYRAGIWLLGICNMSKLATAHNAHCYNKKVPVGAKTYVPGPWDVPYLVYMVVLRVKCHEGPVVRAASCIRGGEWRRPVTQAPL